MSKAAPEVSLQYGGKVNRSLRPWLNRDDAAILQALSPDMRRSFEALLIQQARGDIDYRRVTTGSLLDQRERVTANFIHGAGGGHKRHAIHGAEFE